MFRSTTLKLTGVYLAIIMLISLFFSANLYTLAVNELERGFRRQADVIERVSPVDPFGDNNEVINQRNQSFRLARAHIRDELLTTNIIILITGGALSYMLARRTLRPIEESHEAQKRFTADASHELRTPLTAMQTEIEVALRDPQLSKGEAKDLLRSNLEELAKLTQLSDGLLRLARLEKTTLPKKSLSAAAIVKTVIQDNTSLAANKKIKLVARSQPATTILADRTTLVELLNILVNNAIKYSQPSSTVEIDYSTQNKGVNFSVTDHGVGISQSDLPRIFDRFYRVDSSRSKETTGYGLGLAIAKNIAELQGGYITAKSTQGKGSTFMVHLPVSHSTSH